MADVKKTIDIVLGVVGMNEANVKKISTAFEQVQKAVDNTNTSVITLQKSLNSLKAPESLSKVISSLKEFNAVKIPNLENIADGFTKLNKIKSLPNLQPFANELKKLDNIKFSSLTSITTGLQKLSDPKLLNMSGLAMRVGHASEQLKRLAGIKFSSLTSLTTGLQKLSDPKLLNMSGLAMRIDKVVTQLNRLSNLKIPGVNQIATGLQKLSDPKLLNMSGLPARVGTIERQLKRLAAINLTALATVLSNISKINLDRVASSIKKTGDAASGVLTQLGPLGKKIETVFQFRMISQGLLALQAGIRSGFTAIVEYNQALKDLQAITSATTLEVAQMGTKILEVASTTKFSASEVAEGMRVIGQAGFDASEAVQTMQAVSDLATGTLSTMSTTVDLVTTAMRVFQIDASESSQVADVFANAVNKSKLTIDKLRTSMNYVGPIARSAGVSFTEMSAAMGTLANSGLRASMIGTGLRRVFAELLDPSKSLIAAAERVSVSLNELDPSAVGLSTAIANLGIVLQDAQTAFDIFGKRGAAAALVLADSDSGFQRMLTTVGKSGTAAEMASIQMEGLGVSFKNLKDKLGIFAIALGESGISGLMKTLIDLSRDVVDIFTVLANSILGELAIKIGLVTAAIWAMYQGLSALVAAQFFKTMVLGIEAIYTAAIASAGSITALIATFAPWAIAIGLVTAAIVGLLWNVKRLEEATKEAVKMSTAFEELTKTMIDYDQNIANLEVGTSAYNEANKALRTSLVDVAHEYGELTSEALAAAQSINPLTGEIRDGGKALEAYSSVLEKINHEKFIISMQALNTEFEKTKLSGWDSGSIWTMWSLHISKTVSKLELMEKRLRILRDAEGELTEEGKNLARKIAEIELAASRFVTKIDQMGKLDLKDTAEEFTQIAKDAGATGPILTKMIRQFEAMKKADLENPSNMIDKWAKDAGKFEKDLKKYSSLRKTIDAESLEEYRKLESQKTEIVARGNAARIKFEKDFANATTKGDRLQVFQTFQNTKIQIEREALKLRGKINGLEDSARIKKTIQAEENKQKKLNDIEAKWGEEGKRNLRKYTQEIAKVNADYAKTLKRLVDGGAETSEEQLDAYAANLKNREVLYSKHLNDIALLEAKGVFTKVEADRKRMKATLDYNRQTYNNAVLLQKKITALDGDTTTKSDERIKADKKVADATKALYKDRTDYILAAYKIEQKAKEDLAKLSAKSTAEMVKHEQKLYDSKIKFTKKKKDLEKDYVAEVLAIQKKKNDAIKELDKELLSNKKALELELLEIGYSGEDKIRAIRQRGMTDEQKAVSDQKAAMSKLAEGRRLIAAAERENDKDKLAAGVALIKQYETLASSSKSASKAIASINTAQRILEGAAKAGERIKAWEIEQKKIKEVQKETEALAKAELGYDRKVQSATAAYNKITQQENIRHNNVIANNLKEQVANNELTVQALKNLQILDSSQDNSKKITDINAQTATFQKQIGTLEKINKKIAETGDIIPTVTEQFDTSWEDANKKFMRSWNDIDGVWEPFEKEAEESFAAVEKTASDLGEAVSLALTQEEIDDTISEFAEDLGVAKETAQDLGETEITPKINNEELVQMNETITSMVGDKIINILIKIPNLKMFTGFKKDWDALKDKIITLTTRHVSSGSASYSKFASGGRLPGFGGGDRNHALLEDGEWVINKFAVKKFGDSFMNSINNMSLPGFKAGGVVGSVNPNNINIQADPLSNFGKVQIDTGKTSIPALISKETFIDLTTQLSNAKRFAV